MLFSRHISKRGVVFASAFASVFSLAHAVIQIIVYAQGSHGPMFLSSLLVSLGIFAACLIIMISFIKDKKNVALITTVIAMPLYGTAIFFANVDGFIDGTYAAMEFWPLGLCFIEYLVVALTVIESFVYVIINFSKAKEILNSRPLRTLKSRVTFCSLSKSYGLSASLSIQLITTFPIGERSAAILEKSACSKPSRIRFI